MREYGQVQSSFWQSRDFEGFSDSAKLLALYLLTGPHTNGIGCFRMTDGYVTDDLGWSSETVSESFAELSRNGFAKRFGKIVFIPKFLRWNSIANGNVAKARFKEFDTLPKSDAKIHVARAMLEFCQFWCDDERTVLETVSKTVTETVCQPEPNPTQTQKEPRENPESNSSSSAAEDAAYSGSNQSLELTPPTDLVAKKAQRLSQVTEDAVNAYNACLGKPNGKLAAVHLLNDVRKDQVKRCLQVASQICQRLYGSPTITPQFWAEYFAECKRDPFLAGEVKGGKGHENYVPDFELLTRKEKMTALFDKAMSEDNAA